MSLPDRAEVFAGRAKAAGWTRRDVAVNIVEALRFTGYASVITALWVACFEAGTWPGCQTYVLGFPVRV